MGRVLYLAPLLPTPFSRLLPQVLVFGVLGAVGMALGICLPARSSKGLLGLRLCRCRCCRAAMVCVEVDLAAGRLGQVVVVPRDVPPLVAPLLVCLALALPVVFAVAVA